MRELHFFPSAILHNFFAFSLNYFDQAQSYPATQSGGIRPVSPTEFGHPETGFCEG